MHSLCGVSTSSSSVSRHFQVLDQELHLPLKLQVAHPWGPPEISGSSVLYLQLYPHLLHPRYPKLSLLTKPSSSIAQEAYSCFNSDKPCIVPNHLEVPDGYKLSGGQLGHCKLFTLLITLTCLDSQSLSVLSLRESTPGQSTSLTRRYHLGEQFD